MVDCLLCLERIRKVDWKVSRPEASREKPVLKLVLKPYGGTVNFCVRQKPACEQQNVLRREPQDVFPHWKINRE